jgi:NADH-quinone oxidoreductase subunit C
MAEQPKPEGAAKPAEGGAGAAKPKPAMATTPWESELVTEARTQYGDQILEASTYLGQNFFVTTNEALIPLLEFLRLEGDYDYLVDLTAVHYPQEEKPFEVVYILYSFSRNDRVRVKVRVAEGEQPATAIGVYLTANWMEREVFDMFGVTFAGHPDMRRLLLPEEWTGYPLRKDHTIIQMDNRWVQDNLNIESGQ